MRPCYNNSNNDNNENKNHNNKHSKVCQAGLSSCHWPPSEVPGSQACAVRQVSSASFFLPPLLGCLRGWLVILELLSFTQSSESSVLCPLETGRLTHESQESPQEKINMNATLCFVSDKCMLCWLLWPTMPSLPWERSECVLWEWLLSGRREWHWHMRVRAGLQWDGL
jgi:hypothetical protein